MEHPKGFYMLSSATMLESFSYFVFAVILVLYMTDVLHFTDSFSTYFFGIAYGMTYLFQIVGGYLSDRYLGNRKVVLIGIILIAIAQLILHMMQVHITYQQIWQIIPHFYTQIKKYYSSLQ